MIKIENLSKKYLIYRSPLATNLRESLTLKAQQFKRALLGKREAFAPSYEEMWSLRDVNVEIPQGSRVGIIGANGAGKSTFLKILSRIVVPTQGKVTIEGRVSSLLEVGTGFHPELTGRENIYLNGAILGMSRAEIQRKFSQIVAYSELEMFLDTPLKRFSSGMQMRLAFSVAAHLDPDIFIVDEVLAVGDMRFQEKCLKTLREISQRGATIIFVSHEISKILELCNLALFFERGHLQMVGTPEQCVAHYLGRSGCKPMHWVGCSGTYQAVLYTARLIPAGERLFFYQGERIGLALDYEVKEQVDLVFQVEVLDDRGRRLATSRFSTSHALQYAAAAKGRHQMVFEFEAGLFHQGAYTVRVKMGEEEGHFDIELALTIYESSFREKSLEESGICLGGHWSLREESSLIWQHSSLDSAV